MITIFKLNESFMKITSDNEDELDSIKENFTFFVNGYRYNKKFLSKLWDGKIRLLNYRGMMPVGLISNLVKYCKQHNIEIEFANKYAFKFNNQMEFVEEFLNKLDSRLEIRNHQLEALKFVAKNNRGLILSSTNSGKSYVMYLITRFWMDQIKLNKIVIVVPSVKLVNQLKKQFIEYSSKEYFDSNYTILYAGANVDFDKRVLISTWQSLKSKPDSFFAEYGGILTDECHLANAANQTRIVESMINSRYKIGLTGSLSDYKVGVLQLTGSYGEGKQFMTARESIELGISADTDIKIVKFDYSKRPINVEKQILNDGKGDSSKIYNAAIKFIINDIFRNSYIVANALTENNNSLILVRFVKHAKFLYKIAEKMLDEKSINSNKVIRYIDGSTKSRKEDSEVNQILNEITHNDNVVLIATYGTMSFGIDNDNLHNLHLAFPVSSSEIVKQSIGRMLRKKDGKDKIHVKDYYDDLPIFRKQINTRISTYNSEKHYYERETVDI